MRLARLLFIAARQLRVTEEDLEHLSVSRICRLFNGTIETLASIQNRAAGITDDQLAFDALSVAIVADVILKDTLLGINVIKQATTQEARATVHRGFSVAHAATAERLMTIGGRILASLRIETGTRYDGRRLHETAQQVRDYIDQHHPCLGEEIAAALGITEEHVRRLIRKLRSCRNLRGRGYVPPGVAPP